MKLDLQLLSSKVILPNQTETKAYGYALESSKQH